MCIQLKPPFSRHKGIGVQFTDEPTGSLDSANTEAIMDLFFSLNKQGKTIIIVTHDKELAEKCHRIIEISDGRII